MGLDLDVFLYYRRAAVFVWVFVSSLFEVSCFFLPVAAGAELAIVQVIRTLLHISLLRQKVNRARGLNLQGHYIHTRLLQY